MRTPMIALRDRRKEKGQHAGLLLQRYLCENAAGDGGNPEEKRALLLAAIHAAKNADVQSLYRAAFNRWSASLPNDPSPTEVATVGRLIVGLGSENVLETGITLHHTYGMPIIPGSALKGVAAHYCDQVWGERSNTKPSDEALKYRSRRKEDRKNNCKAEPQGCYHSLLFGATEDGGCITFYDAWFVPDSENEPLKLDVMTPHHPDYNRDPEKDPKFRAPTDFDSPIPVPFLSVAGKFRVAVSWNGPDHDQPKAKAWTKRALELLCDALFDWGVGGKTSSGYGQFDKEQWEKDEATRRQEIEKQRKEAEQAAALAAMTPIERSIKEFLQKHPDKNAKEYMKLLKELERTDGRFQTPADRRAVAERVKAGMQAEKAWKEKEPHGKRKKFIELILGDKSSD